MTVCVVGGGRRNLDQVRVCDGIFGKLSTEISKDLSVTSSKDDLVVNVSDIHDKIDIVVKVARHDALLRDIGGREIHE